MSNKEEGHTLTPVESKPKDALDRRAFIERFASAAGIAAATTLLLTSTNKAGAAS